METVVVRGGVTLRADPSREPCFRVIHDQADKVRNEEGSPEHRREWLHAEVNEEIQSLEIAAQSLVDFPDASWELRLELARQCWDETRHARGFLRRLLEVGGRKGEFPVINQEWGVVCMFDSLVGRLAVQNRLFEAGSLDVARESADTYRGWGDHATADVVEAVIADEIHHVRFAKDWLDRLKTVEPRALLKAVAAMSAARSWIRKLVAPGAQEHDIAVNVEDRRHAGLAHD